MSSSGEQVPDRAMVEELLAYLPGFSAPGRQFVRQFQAEVPGEGEVGVWPHPDYDDDVVAFFMSIGLAPWIDPGYRTSRAEQLIAQPDLLADASYADVRAVLNYCSRGERFCDGYWLDVLQRGVVQAALARLDVLVPE
jgi:hypothetical protein